jgi:hypothetical protein
MILFTNPGEIDPRLITTLGVNVKENDSPIGFFGTGLKYAIAVLLREAQEVTIFSGRSKYEFKVAPGEIRGKSFNFIKMSGKTLGFTTELGKNWTLNEAYRELYSNCKDENGSVASGTSYPIPGRTIIAVRGAKFEAVHAQREQFILAPSAPPLFANDEIEIFAGSSNVIFYRGVAAQRIETKSHFTYNILSDMELTEDRTFKYQYYVNMMIKMALATAQLPESDLVSCLSGKEFERVLDFSTERWSEQFMCAARRAIADYPLDVCASLTRTYHERKGTLRDFYPRLELTLARSTDVEKAIEKLCFAGFDLRKYEITFVTDLGYSVVGLALNNEIFISELAFTRNELVETLLEEFIHLEHGVIDETRAMQNVLLREIVRLVG